MCSMNQSAILIQTKSFMITKSVLNVILLDLLDLYTLKYICNMYICNISLFDNISRKTIKFMVSSSLVW